MNPMKYFFAELLERIALKIFIKCYKKITVRFTCKIQVISMSKCFIGLGPGEI